MKKLQDTDPRVQEAIVLYKSGLAVHTICEKLKMDRSTLRRVLLEKGILRTRSEAIQKGKSKAIINHDILDILTPEALYWIGFLYADGHIEKDRPRITVTLEKKDRRHLEKMIKFFGLGLTLRELGSGHFRVAFSSKKIYEKLIILGFNNRKTYAVIPHEELKHSRDFWRGVVDGDGWIYNKGIKSIGLCGHKNTLNEFLIYLNKNNLDTKAMPNKVKKGNHLWQLEFHHTKSSKVANLLYKDSTVHLDRKYNEFINWNKITT